MKVIYRPKFEKMLAIYPRDIIFLVSEMIELFREDPYHPSLRNHPLTPPLDRYSSISIDADIRILYRMIDLDTAVLLKIGDHQSVYIE